MIKNTKDRLETLKNELDKEVLTLKHMKLEIGNITMKYIISTYKIIALYSEVFLA